MKDIVCKFGGTSLANAESVKKVINIVTENRARFVVVSAPGKRYKTDDKITDLLISCYNLTKSGEDIGGVYEKIVSRYKEIIRELNLDLNLDADFEKFRKKILSGESLDYVSSRGEYFMAKVMAKALGRKFLDAKDFISFNKLGEVDLEKTKKLFLSVVKDGESYVISGFYGLNFDGKIKTFSRGGSDLTGAIVCVVAGIKLYYNYTDVNGFMRADPKIVPNACVIKKISYGELRSLCYTGANVLHPDCCKFLRNNKIVVNLRNTFNPTCKGSLIMPDSKILTKQNFTGISGNKGFKIITIEKFNINENLQSLATIYSLLKKYNVQIEHIPTGIDSISIIVKSEHLNDLNEKNIVRELKNIFSPDKLNVTGKVGIINVVGGALKNESEVGRVLQILSSINVNLVTLNKLYQGLSLVIGVAEDDFERAIKTLYEKLF